MVPVRTFLILLMTCLLASVSAGSSKRSRDVDKTEAGLSLNDKVQQLLDLSQRRVVVKLTSKTFKELVKSAPKN